ADDGSHGTELWKSDGTEAGTVLVKDVNPASFVPGPADLTAVGGTLFFTADDGRGGRGLWKSDGTPDGTTLVKAVNPPADLFNSFELGGLAAVGGTLFFSRSFHTSDAPGPRSGWELWKSDGTSEGTVRVHSFSDAGPLDLIAVGGTLFFT